MKDNDLITRREVELVLLEKGQRSRRYKLGDVWELNFDEIREALSEYQPKIVRCVDCVHRIVATASKWRISNGLSPYECKLHDILYSEPDWFCADGKRKSEEE